VFFRKKSYYLLRNQIWLIYFLDDRHFGYISKSFKKKPGSIAFYIEKPIIDNTKKTTQTNKQTNHKKKKHYHKKEIRNYL
jgi:hypothetical protein